MYSKHAAFVCRPYCQRMAFVYSQLPQDRFLAKSFADPAREPKYIQASGAPFRKVQPLVQPWTLIGKRPCYTIGYFSGRHQHRKQSAPVWQSFLQSCAQVANDPVLTHVDSTQHNHSRHS